MNTFKKILVSAALFVSLFSGHISSAADTANTEEKKQPAPIQIEADQMLSSQKDNAVFFSGKVEAEQGDVIIRAEEMTVYYAETQGLSPEKTHIGAENSQSIKRILAAGNVEITKGEWVATGETAEYFENERKVVLVGNTKVWQNNNLITGDIFTMYLDEGKSIVERSTQKNERVKAFFYPSSNKKQ